VLGVFPASRIPAEETLFQIDCLASIELLGE